MQLSKAGAEFIRAHEGFVPKAYLDPVGVLTIGTGFTWASGGFREWWERNRPGRRFDRQATMTRAESDAALIFLCEAEYGAAVNRFLGRDVPQHVFDGATSVVFNLGPGALEWKWAEALKRGAYAEAGELLRSTGTTAKGRRLPGLVTRRIEEAQLIELGDYTIGGTPAAPLADGVLMKGERGDAVLALQRDLAALGHYVGRIDGRFGVGTEAAVLAFQRAAGLKADGVAGQLTLEALERETPGPATVAPTPVEPMFPEPVPVSRGRQWIVLALIILALIVVGWLVFAMHGAP